MSSGKYIFIKKLSPENANILEPALWIEVGHLIVPAYKDKLHNQSTANKNRSIITEQNWYENTPPPLPPTITG